ncbi:MAG: hypothetical protein OXQ29_18850 [Rhodospirillaceae bacterium]|nr:hypothetical protein [Rhodospirillaceae bacterium]
MLRENLGPFGATVFLTGDFTQESAIDLVERIRKLNDSYFYPEVDIEIASPGGETAALFYCADALRPNGVAGVAMHLLRMNSVSKEEIYSIKLFDER